MNYFFSLLFILCSGFSFGQSFDEKSYNRYLEKNKDSLNVIEGYWNVQVTQELYHYDTLYDVVKNQDDEKIAVVKSGMIFTTFNSKGNSFNVEFTPTDVKGVYLYRNYFPEISDYSKVQAVISKRGEMEYTFDYPLEYLKAKFGDKYGDNTRIVNILKWTRINPPPGK